MGRDRRMAHDLIYNSVRLPQYTGSTPEMIQRDFQRAHQATLKALQGTYEEAKEKQAAKPRKKIINAADLVFHEIHVPGNIRQKLSDRYEGPYRVLETRQNKAKCRNLQTDTEKWFHVDTLKPATKVLAQEFTG